MLNELIAESETPLERRASIHDLENVIAQSEQLELTTNHYFGGGVYVRELHIPAGAVVTGKIHRCETMNILMKGDISIATEDGFKRIQAPMIFPTRPLIKKAVYAHSDVIFVNVHPTEETDLEKIEAQFITNDYDTLEHDSVSQLEEK